MKFILQDKNQYMLRFDRGEDIIQGVIDFCGDQSIIAGYFSVIGAASEIVISYYNLDKKEYEDRHITENLEIAGVIGNVATLDGTIIVHAHGTFSDSDMQVLGGHIKKIIVSATGEVMFNKLDGVIVREYDDNTGLNLMK